MVYMHDAIENGDNPPMLPAERYYSALPKKQRGEVLRILDKTVGKAKTTYIRWFYGLVYPPSVAERNAVAKALKEIAGCRMSGDALFPEDYPYRGANN